MDRQRLAELRRVFGDGFLGYILDVSSTDTLEATPWTPGRLAATQVLEQIWARAQEGEGTPEGLLWAARQGVDQFMPEVGKSIASALRETSGGTAVPAKASSDPVLNQLFAMLPDVYPGMLLPPDDGPFMPQTSSVPYRHPRNKMLEEAVLADPVLTKLYIENSEASGWTGSVYRSTGQGGGTQLRGFASQQFGVARAWAALDHDLPTIDDVAEKLEQTLGVLRAAVQGKNVTVPVRIGLTGVLLPESISSIDLGWARLARPNANDRMVAEKTGVAGKLQTSLADGEVVTIDYAGDVVLLIDLPYKIHLGSIPFSDPWPSDLMATLESLGRTVETLRLGLALALDDDQIAVVIQSWQLMIDPLAHAALPGWNDTRRTSNLVPRMLTESQVSDWKEWSVLVADKRSPSIAISIRRMLQALAERHAPEDVLVDAVVVWENLFGTSVETTHRVCTSMAWLLGGTAYDRANLQKRYKELYSMRSGIVHGSPKIRADKIPEASRETVRISLAALRELFKNRPDILQVSKSEERGNRLLLDIKADVDAPI